MTWFDGFLIGLLVLNAVTYVARVNQPREPITASHAAIEVGFDMLLILGVVFIR